ncbi:MAG: glycosyltransferase [Euryarchaeota archaeon]|nr:glycosyltransferase [Euryarchaeota archaeon]
MKVCILSPYPEFRNGLSAYTAFLIEKLRNYVEVSPISFYQNRTMPLLKEFSSPIKIRKICKRIEEIDPTVVHIQFTTVAYPKVSFSLLLSLLRKLNRPIVLTQHEAIPEIRKIKLRTGYEKFIYEKVDAIIAHTEHIKKYLLDIGVPKEKVAIIPHGVHIASKISKGEAREKLNLSSNALILLVFGYISRHKGIEYAIKAMRSIRKDVEQARLIIAGGLPPLSNDFAYLKKLKALSEAEGVVGKTLFTGYVEDELISSYHRAADILLLPYTNASESGILHLAVGAGLPIIASNIKGLEIVSQNGIGLSVDPYDSESIAAAVKRLLKDKELYQKCIKACQNLAKERCWEKIAEMHVQLYESLKSNFN